MDFRRLESKAQVFSRTSTGVVRTRLTHSIEVSNYGELIGEKVAAQLIQNGSLPEELRLPFVQVVENACLMHDIGNPPFGHMGEYAIRRWFQDKQKDLASHWKLLGITCDEGLRYLSALAGFDGNPQGFRITTRLQWLHDQYGMNLTCALLAAYLKYVLEVLG